MLRCGSSIPLPEKLPVEKRAAIKIDTPTTDDSKLSKWKPQIEYRVSPSLISYIEHQIVSLPAGNGKAIGYDAILHNGDQVTCFLLFEGEYKGEKWALLYKNDAPPVPIPADNFDILKKLYNFTRPVVMCNRPDIFSKLL